MADALQGPEVAAPGAGEADPRLLRAVFAGSTPSPKPFCSPPGALNRPSGVPGRFVACGGRMTPNGWQPENHEWRPFLLDGDGSGRDPRQIDTAVLTAAGHGRRSCRAALSAKLRAFDFPLPNGRVTLRDLREHCLGCSGGPAAVRSCEIHNCPLWAFRMGTNPHDPRRGKNPFAPVGRA